MWNALRADFQEFVSTVADDTSNVLSQLDSGMEDENGNIITAADCDGTDDNNNNNEEDGNNKNKNKEEVDYAELKEIMTLLRDHPGTYTEDLADEVEEAAQVEEFLKDFSIEAKTDEIATILEEHEDTVKKHFEEIVPTQVAYEDFWKRYFYRVNEERIAQQLQEETERARQARAEAIENGIKSVTNFFGGAVKAVTSTIAPEAGAGDGETPASNAGGTNFFGAKGRPPFVMNTAVSESGDDDEDDDDELGWDDDDDDDEDEEADTTTEQIEFTDKVSEDLKDKLKQAIEERDQIQQTVHLQADEIKALQEKLSVGASAAGSSGSADKEGELEQLKLQLFEKDAELAALKARVHDDGMDDEGADKVTLLIREAKRLSTDELAKLKLEVFGEDEPKDDTNAAEAISALEQQIEQLKNDLSAKDDVLVDTNQKLETSVKQLEAVRSDQANNAQAANAAVSELETKLKTAQEDAVNAQKENASQISSLKQMQDESQQQVSSLTTEVDDLKLQLQQAQESLKQKDVELAGAKQAAAAPKVDTPAFSTPVTATATIDVTDDDLADDWGDDWD